MKIYKKNYDSYGQEDLTALHQKYLYLNEIKIPGVLLPTMIGQEGSSLLFEHIEMSTWEMLPVMVADLERSRQEKIYRRIGQVLGKLHACVRPRSYIHGDFFPRNIYVSKQNDMELMILDFDPPHGNKNRKDHITNQKEKDLACFLVRAPLTLPPSHRLRYLTGQRGLLREFIEGYRSEGQTIQFDKVDKYMSEEISAYKEYLHSISWIKGLFWRSLLLVTTFISREFARKGESRS